MKIMNHGLQTLSEKIPKKLQPNNTMSTKERGDHCLINVADL